MPQLSFLLYLFLSCSPYDGTDIDYDNTVDTSISKYASGIKNHQSAAIYGELAFFVTDKRSRIYIYNMQQCQIVDSVVMSTRNDKTPSGYTLYHCNQCSFSPFFYSPDDKYPLLYISQWAREDKRSLTDVYRICTNPETGNLVAKFVQMLHFPAMSDENSLGNVCVVLDAETSKIYTYSKNNNKSASNDQVCRISCFDIPPLDEKDVYLDDEDILYSFSIPCSGYQMQGGCIHNGLLFIGQGVTEPLLRIVDLNTKSLKNTYNIKKQGYKFEPEGCFWYDGSVMLCSKNTIYQVKFTEK